MRLGKHVDLRGRQDPSVRSRAPDSTRSFASQPNGGGFAAKGLAAATKTQGADGVLVAGADEKAPASAGRGRGPISDPIGSGEGALVGDGVAAGEVFSLDGATR